MVSISKKDVVTTSEEAVYDGCMDGVWSKRY